MAVQQIDQLLLASSVSAGEQQRDRVDQADGGVEEVAVLVTGGEKVQREIIQGDLKIAFGVQIGGHLAHRPE